MYLACIACVLGRIISLEVDMKTTLRVATFLCERCHRDAKTVCTIWQEGRMRQLWWAACLSEARNGNVGIARETCQQCYSQTEAASDVFWHGCYRIWCPRCVQEQEYPVDQTKDPHVVDDDTR